MNKDIQENNTLTILNFKRKKIIPEIFQIFQVKIKIHIFSDLTSI